MKTNAQLERESARGASGKFIANPCELCGKGASMTSYWSWEHCNDHGIGVTLHARCSKKLEKMSEAAALAALKEARGVRAAS